MNQKKACSPEQAFCFRPSPIQGVPPFRPVIALSQFE